MQNNKYIFYITLIIGLLIDLITKFFANIYFQKKINIFGDFVYFKYIENPGIAFSISIPFLILKTITIFLIILIFYYYNSERKKSCNKMLIDISFGLILSGAIGNAIGRIFNESVIDFIGIKYFSIFNIADSFIVIGMFLYILYLYSPYNKES